MKALYKKECVFEEVKTKSGAVLKKITLNDNHFFLEQNPLKDSKYGKMYKEIKSANPDFYMFWEIKNDEYTGEVLIGEICKSKDLEKELKKFQKS